jgi:hypothetical protein
MMSDLDPYALSASREIAVRRNSSIRPTIPATLE